MKYLKAAVEWVKEANEIAVDHLADGLSWLGARRWAVALVAVNMTAAGLFIATHPKPKGPEITIDAQIPGVAVAVPYSLPSQLKFNAGATGSVTRSLAGKEGDWVSIKDFGCVGDGATDNAVCLQAAIDSLSSFGGTVYIPPGDYRTTVGILSRTGNRGVHLLGAGMNVSIISGTGISIYTIQSDRCSIEDLQIAESNANGNAATIGVDIFLDYVSGINWWFMKHVYLQGGTNNNRLGTGVKMRFALKGNMVGVLAQRWNVGILVQGQSGTTSNANTFTGVGLHDNNTGFDFSDSNSMDGTSLIAGGVLGHNNIGITFNGTFGTLTVAGVHLENNLGASPKDIVLTAGNLMSSGNGFYLGSGSNSVVMSGSSTLQSFGDTINAGITNNGTGIAYIFAPRFSPTTTGSGLFVKAFDGNTIVGSSSQTLAISGYGLLDVRIPIINYSGSDTQIAANTSKKITFGDHTVTPLQQIDEVTGKTTMYAKVNTAGWGVPAIHGTPVLLTGQTANLAATNVYAAAPVGEYEICATARTTTSGSGTTATLNIIWTDEGGVKTDAVGTWALNSVTVTGQINKCEFIHAAAASNIQVSVTAGTYGTSVYALSATAERLN